MIPRIFHHIWPGDDPIPDAVQGMRETWRRHHPHWELRLWLPAELEGLRNQALYDRATSYAQKADIARFEIVERHGGVYLDTDMECLRPIDTLVDRLSFFAGRERQGVGASIFGAVPGHPLLREVIASLPVSCLCHRLLNMQTGPTLLTQVMLRRRWEARPGVRIFPAPFFYPYDWTEPWRRGDRFPTAFAVHHWSHSWKGEDVVRPRAADLRPTSIYEARVGASALLSTGLAELRRQARVTALAPLRRTARRYLARALPRPLAAVPAGDGLLLARGPLNLRLLCPADDLSLTPDLALDGTYGPDFVQFLHTNLRPGMCVVDVGANLGLYTLVAAQLGCRVHAYECNPEMIDLLERNVAMNWLDDRVTVVRKAASNTSGPARFFAPREMRGLGSLVQPLEGRTLRSAVADITVECERLDTGLAETGFIDLLKIDTEGAESEVLEGAEELLNARGVGMLAIEYRSDAMDDLSRARMEERLAWAAAQGATFHVPYSAGAVPLDEVLTTCMYPNLIVRFPWSSITLASKRDA